MGPQPIPTLDKLAGDLGPFGPERLDHDEATHELYRRLNVGHHFQALLAAEYPQFDVVWFGHIGDGNLHINVLKPQDMVQAAFVHECGRVTRLLADLLAAHGGSISAEHGIGLVKKPYLSSTRSPGEIALMRGIRRVFDPNGILSPHKLFDLDSIHPGYGETA